VPGSPVTLVFTDLVGSTAIKAQLPGSDVTARNHRFVDTVLAPHRRRVEADLAAHGGRAVKTEGDSYFLVFADAVEAVRWASAIQMYHARDPIPTPLGPVAVRIGLHTGSPLPDGDDFIGHEVDYAARVAALANGGQVLLSETTAALVRAAGLADLALHPHGGRDLKGIGRVPIFELLYADRQPTPLREGVLSPSNLPPTPDGFVGRADLVAELREHVRAGGVTILKGEGGIGKTTLALAVAHQAHRDGDLTGGAVWLNCELQPRRDECHRQMAHVFFDDRMEQAPIEACRERIAAHLRTYPGLIILDNFETVARDAEMLRWLVAIRAPASVLVTTRDAPPGLRGRVIDVRELSSEAAAALFTERAASAGTALTDADRADVNALCAAVGNLPLAIELLAARRLLLPRLLERVRQGLSVLDSRGDPTRPDRHQSARACFALSFEHLTAAARDLLLRLSVLPDGAGPTVIAGVAETDDWDEAAEELVATSVWRFADGRYVVHPLLRQFALGELGPARAEAEQHAARAVARVAEVQATRTEPGAASSAEMVAALDWMEAEWRNLLACADFAETAEDWSVLGALADAVRFFFLVRGHWEECKALLTRAVAARRKIEDRAGEGRALNSLANIYNSQGRLDEAEATYRQCLDVRRDVGDRAGQAVTLNNLGIVYTAQERWDEAEACYRDSRAISRDIGDRVGEGTTLNGLANIHYDQGEWEAAERACRECLVVWREIGDRIGEGKTLSNLGSVCEAQKRWAEADACYQESLAVRRELGDRAAEGETLLKMAALREAQGDLAAALDLARQAVDLLETTENVAALAEARRLLAEWLNRVEDERGSNAASS